MSHDTEQSARFDAVDWSEMERDSMGWSATLAVLVLGSLAVGVLFLYDVYIVQGGPVVLGWDITRVDWLSLVATVVIAATVGVPLAKDPEIARDLWTQYPKEVLSIAALVFVGLFLLAGIVGPLAMAPPDAEFQQAQEPPYGFSIGQKHFYTCVGPVSGGACHGTLKHPLGTTRAGHDIFAWVIYGARTALQFALVTLAFMAPIALIVGTVAAYYGGWVDDILMRYVDVQQSVPTVIIYFMFVFLFGPTLFWLIVTYALFNWGDTAQLVRSEAVSESENAYILASESAGGSSLHVIREHLVPNVSTTLLTAATLQIPKLILIEATFSFLGLGGAKSYSWGQLLQGGLTLKTGEHIQSGLGAVNTLNSYWWLIVVPVVVVTLSILLLSLFGDALQSALDPKQTS